MISSSFNFFKKNFKKEENGLNFLDLNNYQATKNSYNAWGNIIYQYDDGSNLSNINPYRYRGYRYDDETGYYYLNSRYYDPSIARFISADSINYLDPSSSAGLNLYAYCNNNPVMYSDPSGNFPILATFAIILLSGVIVHAVTSAGGYVGSAVASIWDEDIRDDMNAIGWNPFNSNEDLVLKSTKVSFYKGSFVVRHDMFGNGSSAGILGMIWLNHKATDATTVKHEWGHNVQELLFGEVITLVFFALPSVINHQYGSYRYAKSRTAQERAYYSKYWERSADFFGGVNRGNYDSFWSWGTFIPWD